MANKTREQIQREFDEGVLRLQSFYDREGHCSVHREHKEDDGYFLGRFVKNNLNKYTHGYLSKENIAKLEAFPGWQWSPSATKQREKLANLVSVLTEYFTEHGSLMVPNDLVVNGENLLSAIFYYRNRYNKNRSSAKEIRALESIPSWSWEKGVTNHTAEQKWETKYFLLLKYAMKHRHSLVPQHYEMKGHKLGSWVGCQRIMYREGTLLPHRAERLEKLDCWVWKKISLDELFEDSLCSLMNFYQKSGVKIPPDKVRTPSGRKLSDWINCQRQYYKKGKLSAKRIKALEAVNGWTWTKEEYVWEVNFKKLQYFSDRFEHCAVPPTYKVKGIGLKWWVDKARIQYVEDKLSVDQRKKLEGLKGWNEFVAKSVKYQESIGMSLTEIGQRVYQVLERGDDLSLSKIAKECQCSIGAVVMHKRNYLKGKGFLQEKVPNELEVKIFKLLDEQPDLPLSKIAEICSCSKGSAKNYRQKYRSKI